MTPTALISTDSILQETPLKRAARMIAFYLPQFYPTPENDAWWGKGFTEWTNVAKAKPLFPGHYQPRLPSELGFYDLRVPETRAAQAELALEHGIEGFCYWHYWFEGRRILDRPFDEVLKSGEPDLPFCLGWANHTWSRRWSGEEKSILVKQTYSPEDDVRHAEWLLAAFADDRYIRVHGRPMFLVYNPYALPDPVRTTDTLRRECTRRGLPEPYLVGLNLHQPQTDPRTLGFDAAVDHQPQFNRLPPTMLYDGRSRSRMLRNLKYRLVDGHLKIVDYATTMATVLRTDHTYKTWPCAVVDWDTTARLGERAIIFAGARPEIFEQQLARMTDSQMEVPSDERFVFINAWNEWGEGMYLEPDVRHGRGYLEAVKRVVYAPPRKISSLRDAN